MKAGSLCQGIGGADLALETHGHTIAWGCELDPAPASVCARHWPDAPNHGDITAVDWSTVEPVDIVSAGFPCPPASTAGKRLGTSDERWIWPAVADAIAAIRPKYVFAENVKGLLSAPGHPLRDDGQRSLGTAAGELVPGHAFGAVLRDLDAIGYVGAWGVLGSADVGGCHRRDRLWIVAADASRGGRADEQVGSDPAGLDVGSIAGAGRRDRPGRAAERVHDLGGAARELAALDLLPTPRTSDTNGPGHHDGGGPDLRTVVADLLPTPTARDWKGQNQRGDDLCLPGGVDLGADTFGRYAPAVARWAAIFGPPPSPTDDRRRLNPEFVEWMLGFPAGWVTDPSLELTRSQQLKALGNAQQPQTAAAAIARLARRVEAQLTREAA